MTAKARKEFYETEGNWKEMEWDDNPFFRYSILRFKKMYLIRLQSNETFQDYEAKYKRNETVYYSKWITNAIYKYDSKGIVRVSKTEALELMKEADK